MGALEIPLDLTVDDLLSLPTDYRYELHEGNLYVMSPAIMWHSRICSRLYNALRAAGKVAYVEVGIKFRERDSRTPDIAVFKDPPDENRAFFPPSDFLLVVEIVSPSSEDSDRIYKPQHYARARIPEYWRVERADDGDDALIFQHELTPTAHGTPVYVQTEVTKLSQLEKAKQ